MMVSRSGSTRISKVGVEQGHELRRTKREDGKKQGGGGARSGQDLEWWGTIAKWKSLPSGPDEEKYKNQKTFLQPEKKIPIMMERGGGICTPSPPPPPSTTTGRPQSASYGKHLQIYDMSQMM